MLREQGIFCEILSNYIKYQRYLINFMVKTEMDVFTMIEVRLRKHILKIDFRIII